MHHGVGEVVFNTILAELLVVFTGHLADEERRQSETANGFEQTENFVARVFHLGEREERTQGVEHQDFEPDGVPITRQLSNELPHPVNTVPHALFVQLNTKVSQINDGDAVAHPRIFHVHAHVGHV